MDYGGGSIYFVKSRNCYAGQVYLEIDGEKIRKSVYGKTERIVKDKIRELQIQAKAGAFKKVDKTTFYELAEKMIKEQVALNEIRQSTYKRKLETLKMLSSLSDKQGKSHSKSQSSRCKPLFKPFKMTPATIQ